ncbi:MAG: hypothetical protein A3K19_01470 [Lentisphaerae bacterium RIFOXYB12_FULL_65_16]|nr:MAG: hypothetical protein A3K18_22825 [Lentisphaerae bacterium RIFOXYA12_64_32]OGV92810.1 MAG: hypothetical protein A3K19_01470 [Lentisphaerae bacterium RIFOXYB12_FULL_65_16]
MTCNDAQRTIIADEQSLSAAVRAHLGSCSACRAFAEAHRHALIPRPGLTPPADLDRQVLLVARQHLAAWRRAVPQKQEGDTSRGVQPARQILLFPVAWWAAAAALAVVGVILACLFLAGRSGLKGPVVASSPSPVTTSTAPDWHASALDADMLALAVDLAMDGPATVTVASGTEDTAVGKRGVAETRSARGSSIEDAILELELNLFLDEGLTSEPGAEDGVRVQPGAWQVAGA